MRRGLRVFPAIGLLLFFLAGYAPVSKADPAVLSCVEDDDCGAGSVCLSAVCSVPPQYFLLFTHTEDHINNDLSEERYRRFFPAIDELARAYPEAHVSWTVEFMGADSETVAARDPQTGLLDFIRGYAANGSVFQFGYHGAHEPTYANNAIANLGNYQNASWGDVITASRQFLTLGKDPTRGGVDPNRSGGLKLMQETFGPAKIISGYGSDQAQIHTADALSSSYVMFGFADHGDVITGSTYTTNVKEFMTPLCPERSTPCGLFWMNGKLRINDGNPVEGVRQLNIAAKQDDLLNALNQLNLNSAHVQVINAIVAPKFIYALESPTGYAYDHPDAPELPPDRLVPWEQKEQMYQNSFSNLAFLAGTYLPSKPGSRFVSGPDIQNLFLNEANQAIPIDRIIGVAQALAEGYNPNPPDFVRSQGHYYTLAESWSLIVQALAQYRSTGVLPETVTLLVPHGPINEADALTAPVPVATPALLDTAVRIAASLKPASWQPFPQDMIPASVTVGTKKMNAAEYLRAAAVLLTQIRNGTVPGGVTIQPASLLTNLYQLLAKINMPKYQGVCWSLKPAKHK